MLFKCHSISLEELNQCFADNRHTIMQMPNMPKRETHHRLQIYNEALLYYFNTGKACVIFREGILFNEGSFVYKTRYSSYAKTNKRHYVEHTIGTYAPWLERKEMYFIDVAPELNRSSKEILYENYIQYFFKVMYRETIYMSKILRDYHSQDNHPKLKLPHTPLKPYPFTHPIPS